MISLGAFMVLIGVLCLFLGYADPVLLLRVANKTP